MTDGEAKEVLANAAVVQVTVAAMNDVMRMRTACLEADIPALMGRPDEGCGSGG